MYARHCKKQKPRILSMRGSRVWCLTVTYFHTGRPALSSAQGRFTVLFGMGRGGSTLLWPSGIDLPGDQKAPHNPEQSTSSSVLLLLGSALHGPPGPWGQAARAISNGQLNVSPRFHTRPINVLVSDGPSGRSSLREVSSRGGFPA